MHTQIAPPHHACHIWSCLIHDLLLQTIECESPGLRLAESDLFLTKHGTISQSRVRNIVPCLLNIAPLIFEQEALNVAVLTVWGGNVITPLPNMVTLHFEGETLLLTEHGGFTLWGRNVITHRTWRLHTLGEKRYYSPNMAASHFGGETLLLTEHGGFTLGGRVLQFL